jgi:hypothetical protein
MGSQPALTVPREIIELNTSMTMNIGVRQIIGTNVVDSGKNALVK